MDCTKRASGRNIRNAKIEIQDTSCKIQEKYKSAGVEAFEKLEVWKRSCRLSVDLFKTLNGCRDFVFRDQLTRSALSVPSNIAEGYERDSGNEFVRFLRIAKGSCGELRTQLYIAKEIGLIDKAVADGFISEAFEISRMLHGLIRKL